MSEVSPRGPGYIVKPGPNVEPKFPISRRTFLVLAGLGTIATVGVTYGVADFFMQMHQARGSTSLTPAATHSSATPTVRLPESSLYTYRGHLDAVNAVAWSPDGNRLASASDDYTAQVWDATTGDNQTTFPNHNRWVLCVAWSANDQYIATGSDDQTMKVWNTVTRDVLHTCIVDK